MENSEIYETDNFYEAAFLKCEGLALVGKTKRHNKTFLQFEIEKGAISQIIRDYYNGAEVEAIKFVSCHRDIKEYGFGTSG